jgi:pantoate--beta-alanine ligase
VRALAISQSLARARQIAAGGMRDAATIVAAIEELLRAAQLQIDYVAICDRETLAPLARLDAPAVALVAARVGTTRLIDNELLP